MGVELRLSVWKGQRNDKDIPAEQGEGSGRLAKAVSLHIAKYY